MKNKLYLLCLWGLSLGGCSLLNREVVEFKLKLPEKNQSTALKASELPGTRWGLAEPNSVNAIDCYAVYTQEEGSSSGQCYDLSGQALFPVGSVVGQFAAGSEIALEMKSGQKKTIGLIGFTAKTGNCSNIGTLDFQSSQYSRPVHVGKKTVDLMPGTQEITVDVSLESAQVIEKCVVQNQLVLPICSTQITNIRYNNNQVEVTGNCLGEVQSLSLRNDKGIEEVALTISSKFEKTLIAGLAKNFTMKAGAAYHLLVNTGYSQVQVPFTLTLADGSVPLRSLEKASSDGQVVTYDSATGQAVWKSQSTGTSSLLKLYDGTQLIGDVLPPISGSSVTVLTPSGEYLNYGAFSNNSLMYGPSNAALYLQSSVYLKSNKLDASINVKDMAVHGLGVGSATIYFSNSDCTGDFIVLGQSNASLIGNIILIPQNCTQADNGSGMYSWSCANYNYYRLSGSGTYQNNFTVGSFASSNQMYSGTHNPAYCSTTMGTLEGYKFTSSQLTTFGLSDPPRTLTNPVLKK